MLKRRLNLDFERSHLLLGPRRVGKSTFIRNLGLDFELIDLLKTDVYFEYLSRPALLQEQFEKAERQETSSFRSYEPCGAAEDSAHASPHVCRDTRLQSA